MRIPCALKNFANENYAAQFHPAGTPGNSHFSALNTFSDFSSTSYQLDSGGFSNSLQQVTNVSIGWGVYTPDKPSFVLVSKQTPGILKSTTKFVSLQGQIKNPRGNTGQDGCIADFLFSGILNKQ